MTEVEIRVLGATDGDVALGTMLVREYVDATARETALPGEDADIDMILPYIPEYHAFADRYLVEGAAFVTATVGLDVAGGVGISRQDPTTCEMNRLWVRVAHRGRGLGRELAIAALAEARRLGYSRMVLDVVPTREVAIALYRSLGFADADPIHEYAFPMVPLALDL